MSERVGASQGVRSYALLGQPSRIREGCGRNLDLFDGDAVPYRRKDSIDILLDAVVKKLDKPRISTQLRYFGQQILLYRADNLTQAIA